MNHIYLPGPGDLGVDPGYFDDGTAVQRNECLGWFDDGELTQEGLCAVCAEEEEDLDPAPALMTAACLVGALIGFLGSMVSPGPFFGI